MGKYLVVYEKTKTDYSAYTPDLPGVAVTGKPKLMVEKIFLKQSNFTWKV